ncbi:DUF6369 family protein [Pseudoalteromonas sp. SIMBA_162]|uniref:DUF6369 family protein n=1 Tax=Pseudoalteromonas sp. SIMBA_162 TaxID=3080867 RepID=UPI00397AFF9C
MVPFFVIILCFPFSNAFASLFYQYGLYVYDFFFLMAFLVLIKNNFLHGANFYRSPFLYLIALLVLYSLVGSYFEVDKYYIRDFRLIIFTVECYILFYFFYYFGGLTKNKVFFFIIISSLSNIVYFTLLYLGFFTFEDQYYLNNSFRYFDISTYISLVYFSFSSLFVSEKCKLYYLTLILTFFCVVFAGSRVLILASLIVLLVLNYRFIIRHIFTITTLSFVLITYFSASEYQLIDRLLNISPSIIFDHLYIRYEPFFLLLDSFSLKNYLIGGGFGTVFEIPWFEYRDVTIDPVNNFIDITFLTLYAKLGFFSIPLVFVYYLYFIRAFKMANYHSPNILKMVLIIFITLLMLVYSIPYQASSIGLLLGLYFINCLAVKK